MKCIILCNLSLVIPSGNLTVCELENGPVEIVSCPMKNVAIEHGPVEIVSFPSYKMVDLSIVFCRFTRPGIHCHRWSLSPPCSGSSPGSRSFPRFTGAPGWSAEMESRSWTDLGMKIQHL
jgi:hypothetical protein